LVERVLRLREIRCKLLRKWRGPVDHWKNPEDKGVGEGKDFTHLSTGERRLKRAKRNSIVVQKGGYVAGEGQTRSSGRQCRRGKKTRQREKEVLLLRKGRAIRCLCWSTEGRTPNQGRDLYPGENEAGSLCKLPPCEK